MIDRVDEAVAKSLHDVQSHLTGIKEIDEFLEQSLITLGGMVKIVDLTDRLDIKPITKTLMEMNLHAYKKTVDVIAYEIMGREDD